MPTLIKDMNDIPYVSLSQCLRNIDLSKPRTYFVVFYWSRFTLQQLSVHFDSTHQKVFKLQELTGCADESYDLVSHADKIRLSKTIYHGHKYGNEYYYTYLLDRDMQSSLRNLEAHMK